MIPRFAVAVETSIGGAVAEEPAEFFAESGEEFGVLNMKDGRTRVGSTGRRPR